jgi:ABC-type iron transport system FetAB permease component
LSLPRAKWRCGPRTDCAAGRASAGDTASVGLSSIATVVLALLTVLQPTPWYEPRYAMPLIGIVLGNVLNSASLGLDTFYGGVVNARAPSKRSWCWAPRATKRWRR